jgi:hypothetical protein
MIEPRRSFQILRPEAQATQSILPEEPPLEHDEPDNPIHPELEYEVLQPGEDDSQEFVPLPPPTPRRKRTIKNDLKLLISFVCLVIFGYVGHKSVNFWAHVILLEYDLTFVLSLAGRATLSL